jgi:hypothetical protein
VVFVHRVHVWLVCRPFVFMEEDYARVGGTAG